MLAKENRGILARDGCRRPRGIAGRFASIWRGIAGRAAHSCGLRDYGGELIARSLEPIDLRSPGVGADEGGERSR